MAAPPRTVTVFAVMSMFPEAPLLSNVLLVLIWVDPAVKHAQIKCSEVMNAQMEQATEDVDEIETSRIRTELALDSFMPCS